MPLVSAIVVNYRSARLTAACVESLRREAAGSLSLEVVVVDNGPGTEEAEALRGIAGVRLVEPGRNLGYAGGLAEGARVATGEVLLLLNPDLELLPGSLAPLLDGLARPSCGATGPRFVADRGGRVLLPPLLVPRLTDELLRVAARRGAWGEERLRRAWHALARPQWEAVEPMVVPGLVGAAFAVPRGVWERIGPLDDAYPLFFEDTDWFGRLARAGLRAILVPASRIVHLTGQSTQHETAESERRFLASEALYLERHFSAPARQLRRLVASSFPPRPEEPPGTSLPATVSWGRPARALVELSPLPERVPSVALYVDGVEARFPEEVLERITGGRWYLRVTDLATDRLLHRSAHLAPRAAGGGPRP